MTSLFARRCSYQPFQKGLIRLIVTPVLSVTMTPIKNPPRLDRHALSNMRRLDDPKTDEDVGLHSYPVLGPRSTEGARGAPSRVGIAALSTRSRVLRAQTRTKARPKGVGKKHGPKMPQSGG